MKLYWKAMLLAGAAIGALSTPAMAQDVPPEESVSVDEVFVTARRRDETLQDTPVAVTAYSAERLDLRGAADITEINRTTPSVTVQVARGSNSTLISFIRGVGQQDPLWGFEPGVGLYVDDVYYARPQAAVLDIFDVKRVEVLRGPQGTLYGRNTIGGAIKYVTDTIDESELRIRGSYGSYDQRDVIVSGDAVLNDMFAVGASIAKFDRDGYGTNRFTGAEHYDKDVIAARGTLEFTPTDSLLFRLTGDITRDSSNPRHGHRELAPSPGSVYDTDAGAGDDNIVEASGASFLAQWEINDQLTVKSITAYRTGETRGIIDFDNLPAPTLDIPAFYKDRQASQEFQLVYTGDRIQAVAGVYFLNANAAGAFDTVVGNFNLTTFTSGDVDTESTAIFADVSWDATEQLSVSLGGRWTSDEKTGTVFRQRYLGIRSPFFGNPAAFAFEAPRTDYTNSRTFEQFTPRASISWEFNDDLTTYLSYSEGFKSGGFDMRGDAFLYPSTTDGYDSETVRTYELGLKGALFDRRLTFATAVFHSTYEDMQVTVQYPSGANITSVVDNVGEATIQGWELEAQGRLTDELSANLMLSYIDAEFDEYLSFIPGSPGNGFPCAPNPPSPPVPTGCFVDVKALRSFQNTPEWTGSFSLNYTHHFEGGMGSITLLPTASYRSDMQLFETAIPLLDQQAYWIYDASLVWTSEDSRIRVGLHGKNLGDKEYRVGGYNFPGPFTGDSVIGFYGPPRTVTLTAEVRF